MVGLKYDFAALEPYIDTATVQTHYTKHHTTYCTNLNKALEKYPMLQTSDIKTLLASLPTLPQEVVQAVTNNGGGYYNHTLYWENLTPQAKPAPAGLLLDAITSAFVSLPDFQKLFTDSATKLFGSGWTWLVQTKAGELKIVNTANQDCPVSNGLKPLLALDVWEHAYYLKYQNRRAEYIDNWWHVVDWDVVSTRLNSPLL
jgi:Fe-Mn family superoxide dismutase